MYSRLLASIGVAGLLSASPAFAAAPCCDMPCCQDMKADQACCDMPCCKDHAAMDHSTMPMADLSDPFFMPIQTDPPVPPAPPAVTATPR